ncbi:hypothetical protein [Halobacillus andaensis]|uniref:hypothetical protein n=1 Tax=Halobacillus andaensis TaxID=1176239 RepID=UPI003D708B0B
MKRFSEKTKKPFGIITVLLIISTGIKMSLVSVEAQAKNGENSKYPKEIVKGVYKALRKETKGPLPFPKALANINEIKKVEIMDKYLVHHGKKNLY